MINLKITDQAVNYLNKIEGKYFYLALKKAGCSGFSYEMKKINQEQLKELSLKNNIYSEVINNLSIAIPVNDLIYLNNMEIDLKQQGLNKQIVINNPQVENSCGCGNSFDLKIR